MILATLVAVEHIYIMCLETIFTKSRTTARTFNMDVEELSRPSVSTLFKNQGVYNLLLAVLILIAVWVTNDLFWARCLLTYVALVAIYGGFTSSPVIILKQGAPALVACIILRLLSGLSRPFLPWVHSLCSSKAASGCLVPTHSLRRASSTCC